MNAPHPELDSSKIRARCTSHHLACDCREHKIATMVKAAQSAICELEWIKNLAIISPQERLDVQQIIEQGHDACDAIGLIFNESREENSLASEEETHS